jgi:hypothetical protein
MFPTDRPSVPLHTTRRLLPLVLLGLGAGVGLPGSGGPLSGPVAAHAQEVRELEGDRVAVYNLAGRAEIVPGSGSSVVVRVRRGGADGDRLALRVGRVEGREVLSVVYPDDRIVYGEAGGRSTSTTRVAPDGTFGSRGSGGGDRVEVSSRGSGLEAWADLVVEVPPGTSVEAWVVMGAVSARGVEGEVLLDTGSGSVEATEITGPLSVDTGSGEVRASEIRGPVEVDTGSGNVGLRDVLGESVYVDTGSGDVEVDGVEAGSVEVDTGSGGIALAGLAARDVIVDTGSGSVEIDLLSDVDRLEVDTGSGSVTLRAPADLGARVELDTGSGGIDVELPLEVRTMRRDRVEGLLGDGRGEIVVDTGSGAIRLLPR